MILFHGSGNENRDLFLLKTTLPIGTTEIIARKISENTGLSLDEEI